MRAALLAMGVLLVLAPAPAPAADSPTETRLREALRSVTSQLRALEDQRTRWQSTETAQKKELETLKAQLAAAPKARPVDRAGAKAELKECLDSRAEEATAAAALQDAVKQCEASRATETGQSRADQDQARAAAAAASERLQACQAKNIRLLSLTREVLAQLQHGGASEPVLGFKRVELENFAQDVEDKLLDVEVKP
jgi:hypothetical protein